MNIGEPLSVYALEARRLLHFHDGDRDRARQEACRERDRASHAASRAYWHAVAAFLRPKCRGERD